jgi:hypothetical protein
MGDVIQLKSKATKHSTIQHGHGIRYISGPSLHDGQKIGQCPCGGYWVAQPMDPSGEFREINCNKCNDGFSIPAVLEYTLAVSMQRLSYVYDIMGRENLDPNWKPAWYPRLPPDCPEPRKQSKRTRRG